jgi:ABC-type amino acid transport substrate-binding protein
MVRHSFYKVKMEERKTMKKRSISVFCFIVALVFILAACGGNSKSGAAKIGSPADFAGHNIAVQVDTTAAHALDRMIEDDGVKITVSRYEEVTQCFDDLALGRVDAVYVDSVVAAYYTTGSDKYKLAWLDSVGEPMGLCLAKSSDKLAAAVEAAIDTMYFDGSMATIAKTHFGEDFTKGLRDVKSAPSISKDFNTINAGTLMIGSEIGYPPMEYTTDDGLEFIGFDIDVAKRLGELLGLKVEFVNTAWDGIFFGLEKGEYDIIISSVSITPERAEKYILTEPYVSNALCIVTQAG